MEPIVTMNPIARARFKTSLPILLLFAFAVGAFGLGSGWFGTLGKKAAPPEPNLQTQAEEAFEVLSELFYFDDEKGIVYPDDLAGSWIDGDKLIVKVRSKMALYNYSLLLKNFDCVVFEVEARYTLNELNEIRKIVADAYSEEGLLWGDYVDEKTNKIVVTFSKFYFEQGGEEEIIAWLSDFCKTNPTLSDKGVTADLFIIEESGQFHADSIGGRANA